MTVKAHLARRASFVAGSAIERIVFQIDEPIVATRETR